MPRVDAVRAVDLEPVVLSTARQRKFSGALYTPETAFTLLRITRVSPRPARARAGWQVARALTCPAAAAAGGDSRSKTPLNLELFFSVPYVPNKMSTKTLKTALH